MKQPILAELLDYNNERVLHYYCHQHTKVTPTQAKRLFADLLAWLWLNTYRQNHNKKTYLFGSLLALDDVWHAFILHTRDYHQFCNHYFEEYIHHEIEPIGIEHELCPEEIESFLMDCFDYLGEDWVMRYFSDLIKEH